MLVNFGWVRPGLVAGMGRPDPEAWALLAEEGFRAVLTLTEGPPPGDPEAAGLELLHVPLEDFGTPAPKDLERCARFIDEQVRRERPVVVHCFAGQGRTGTVLAAWLVLGGLSPEDAVKEIRRLRPGSLETPGQERAIRTFARRVAKA
jgi:atypical dual specificity phosphatase